MQIVTTPSFALKRYKKGRFGHVDDAGKKRKEMVSTAKQWKNWGSKEVNVIIV